MAEFQNPFFTSTSDDVESEYVAGVAALQTGNCSAASRYFGNAARDGHVSALFNLSLLWGGGSVTPYDFDLAADCWYKAAEAGHPRAKAVLWQLEAADRGGFGADNLAKLAEEANSFIKRTGIDTEFYDGGLNRLKAGSAADQITDGLNKLHVAMRRSGVSEQLAIMARCSIVGHIIAKSPYGDRSQPLRGVDTFFNDIAERTDGASQ